MMQQFLQDARENLPLELLWIILAFILINVVYEEIVKPRLDSHRKKRTVAHRRKKFEEQKRDFLMVHAFKTGKRDKVLVTAVTSAVHTKATVLAAMFFIGGVVVSSFPLGQLVAVGTFGLTGYFMQQAVRAFFSLQTWRDMYENYDEWKKLFAEHGVNVDEVGEHRSLDDE
jgi:hypothetical protein